MALELSILRLNLPLREIYSSPLILSPICPSRHFQLNFCPCPLFSAKNCDLDNFKSPCTWFAKWYEFSALARPPSWDIYRGFLILCSPSHLLNFSCLYWDKKYTKTLIDVKSCTLELPKCHVRLELSSTRLDILFKKPSPYFPVSALLSSNRRSPLSCQTEKKVVFKKLWRPLAAKYLLQSKVTC